MLNDQSTPTPLSAHADQPTRRELIDSLYQHHASTVLGLVASRARADDATIEDACQTAWAQLCAHPEVDLSTAGTVRWLVVTATRAAWKLQHRPAVPAGPMLGEPDDPGELAEPASTGDGDPLERTIDREHYHDQRAVLLSLTARERRFVGLHAAGLSYTAISRLTGASPRTVERQILRARAKLKQG